MRTPPRAGRRAVALTGADGRADQSTVDPRLQSCQLAASTFRAFPTAWRAVSRVTMPALAFTSAFAPASRGRRPSRSGRSVRCRRRRDGDVPPRPGLAVPSWPPARRGWHRGRDRPRPDPSRRRSRLAGVQPRDPRRARPAPRRHAGERLERGRVRDNQSIGRERVVRVGRKRRRRGRRAIPVTDGRRDVVLGQPVRLGV